MSRGRPRKIDYYISLEAMASDPYRPKRAMNGDHIKLLAKSISAAAWSHRITSKQYREWMGWK